ncbi:MAG TPA: ABC transporter permease [Bacteroidia bacterium]|nr:ABC transporter permease [Bacteroidia bacterium]
MWRFILQRILNFLNVSIWLLQEAFVLAKNSLIVNKTRSLLSLLGVTIGIFSVILVFTFIDGLERSIRDSVQSIGGNVIYIQKWPWAFNEDYPWWKYLERPLPKYSEWAELSKQLDPQKYAVTYCVNVFSTASVKFEKNAVSDFRIIGCTYEYAMVRGINFLKGRYFSNSEFNQGKNVVILGYSIAKNLFGIPELAVDREVIYNGKRLQVVGVLKQEGKNIFNSSADEVMLMPYLFAAKFLSVKDESANPYIAVKPMIDNYDENELLNILSVQMRKIRKLKPSEENNFALNQSSLIEKNTQGLFSVLSLAGWVIGGFSILVSAFGIANIMFVSVKERVSVIGIQRALGATKFFILIQFLLESILLTLIGGIIGLIITYIAIQILQPFIDLSIKLSASNILLAINISVLTGIISGFVPAYSASQLDPIESMREGI